jgi:hypothetical protein
VTGASAGLGEQLARALAARGYPLMLVARRRERLEDLATQIRRVHAVEVEVRPCDLADRDERAALRAELVAREVAILCANAGFPTCGAVAENDPQLEADEVEVNVVAVHDLTLAMLPQMLERCSGAILVTGSNAAEQPVPTAATYAATKAFANAFGQALHDELRGTGVTCTVLAPGPVQTEFAHAGGIAGAERLRWWSWQTPERVVEDGLRALESGRRMVIPGPMAKAQAYAGRYTPRTLLFPFLRLFFLPSLRGSRTPPTYTSRRAQAQPQQPAAGGGSPQASEPPGVSAARPA